MYVKIEYVDKYKNPCQRALIILGASLIWISSTLLIAKVTLPLGSWASELPIPEPLRVTLDLILGVGPTVLWVYSFSIIILLIIVVGEWLWARLQPMTKPIKRKIRRFYEAIVELNNRL